jgi:ribosome maturation factor RimP
MGIRQQRIDAIDKIRARISDFKGKKITLVLANQTSVLGLLTTCDNDYVSLSIVVNGWKKTIQIPFAQIKELYFDHVV